MRMLNVMAGVLAGNKLLKRFWWPPRQANASNLSWLLKSLRIFLYRHTLKTATRHVL